MSEFGQFMRSILNHKSDKLRLTYSKQVSKIGGNLLFHRQWDNFQDRHHLVYEQHCPLLETLARVRRTKC